MLLLKKEIDNKNKLLLNKKIYKNSNILNLFLKIISLKLR